jgi:hypothetical protein
MIEMIVRIIAAGVVTDPAIAVGMHVRCCGVPGRLAHSGRQSWMCAHRSGTMRRYMSAAHAMRSAAHTVASAGYMLRKCADRQNQCRADQTDKHFHGRSIAGKSDFDILRHATPHARSQRRIYA